MFSIFEKTAIETKQEPSAHDVLLSEIRANDAALDDLSTREYNFRAENLVLIEGRLCIKCADPAARPEIERRWREIQTERDVLLRTRNGLLARL